jgi:hypothetical protein
MFASPWINLVFNLTHMEFPPLLHVHLILRLLPGYILQWPYALASTVMVLRLILCIF